MKLNTELPADDARIEILPLMDVIFCILTFFILGAVGLTRQQALTQNLPQASTGDSSMSQMLPVSIDASGRIYLERETQPLSFQDLAERLARHQQTNPNEPIVLYANPSVEYDRVMQVLDLVREVGGERATLGITPSSRSALERNSDLRQPLLSPLDRLRANPENQIDFGDLDSTETRPEPSRELDLGGLEEAETQLEIETDSTKDLEAEKQGDREVKPNN